MRVLLTVIAGPHKDREFSFEKHDTFLVGRSRHAHFHLSAKDKFFSRIHFMVEVNPPHCRLIDMGSHNGTFVNGEKVLVADLKNDDQIRAGHTILRVQVQQALASDQSALTISFHATEGPSMALPAIAGLPIEREIGRGALGVTYLGQRAGKGGPLAIKVVRQSFQGSAAQVEAFLQAARLLTQLDHPHIVRLRDVGVCAGGFYFASDYVAGINVSERLQRDGPVSLRRAVHWANQMLLGLQYGHANLFVHRDIKPANVLIEEVDGKDVVRLGDYGVARAYQAAPFSGLALTADILKLASFMPPEVLFNFQEANPLADQYSAAAVIYHLLTGETPMELPKAGDKRQSSLLRRQFVPLRERRDDVPPALADVIHKALARTPQQRFAGVQEFRQALLRAAN